jgi:hypothetical protein
MYFCGNDLRKANSKNNVFISESRKLNNSSIHLAVLQLPDIQQGLNFMMGPSLAI